MVVTIMEVQVDLVVDAEQIMDLHLIQVVVELLVKVIMVVVEVLVKLQMVVDLEVEVLVP